MKVAVLSSASAGGAGIAAHRVYEALLNHSGVEVDFFDIEACGQVDLSVSPTDSASNGRITNTHFTVDYASETRSWFVDLFSEYDAINIQWASYLISLSEILELAKLGKRILFTLHDFHYLTGGCHYPAGCTGFLRNCVGCPQVDERKLSQSLVIRTSKLKREIFSYPNVHLSAPSAFIVNSAVRAGIVPDERAHVLRNAYKPIVEYDPGVAGSMPSILLIADSFDEERKGLALAVEALRLVAEKLRNGRDILKLHLVGGLDQEVTSRLYGVGIEVVSHGHIKEHARLVDIFKECDFVLSCSYEDNWPNILVEAASYGCVPIVGRWHGCEEFVDQFQLGYKAELYSPASFSAAISEALSDCEKLRASLNDYVDAVRKAHNEGSVSEKYLETICAIKAALESDEAVAPDRPRHMEVSVNHLLMVVLGGKQCGKNQEMSDQPLKLLQTPFGVNDDCTEVSKEFAPGSLSQTIEFAVLQRTDAAQGYGLANYEMEMSEIYDER